MILFRHRTGVFDAGPPATRIFGVLNLTPDSFSDGGLYEDVGRAVDRALRMEDEGADVIDIGGVSTRPGAESVSLEAECARVLPVLEALDGRLGIPISLDTFRAEVLERGVERGVSILNDVSALRADEAMAETAARTGCGVVLMHMLGVPKTMQESPCYDDVVGDVAAFLAEAASRARAAGIPEDAILLDPGIGFGKTVEHNLALLRDVPRLTRVGYPLLYGTSRKSFLGMILDRPDPAERQYATAATTAHLLAAGVSFLRLHDVRAGVDVIRVLERLSTPPG